MNRSTAAMVKPGTKISVLKLQALCLQAGTAVYVHDGIAYAVQRVGTSQRLGRKGNGIWKVTDDYETAAR